MKNEIYSAKIIDLALLIEDNLIISDLHLGYEQALNSEGLMIPKFQYEKIITRLEEIFNQIDLQNVKTIIINGDLKHEFAKISKQEWREVINFLKFLKKNFEEIILIKGNHDNFTRYIAEKCELEIYETYSIGDYLLMHGHKLPSNLEKLDDSIIIIGHEHPCIGLRSGERVEKIKCFLKGKWKGIELIVMPSFNFITEGSDILNEKLLSPFLDSNSIQEFEVFAVENFEIFHFNKINDILSFNDNFPPK
ncbi:MAG: metallophosphoesterase [Methanobacteriaceae archaeon]|nr:metallophosphoesterase [Methanobacteriaceae archaeon]